MKLKQIDMHWHSIYSDGKVTPQQGVKIEQKAGIKLFALTDHDTIEGISRAIRAAKKLGNIKLILPYNAEFTSSHNGETTHILGYCFHPEDKKLRSFFASQKKTKIDYTEKVVDRLTQTFRFDISIDDVLRFVKGTMNDVHIYEAIIENSKKNSKNSHILQKNNIKTFKDFNKIFLKGFITFQKKKYSTKSVIKMIRNAGGYAVLAHPLWKKTVTIYNVRERVEIFRDMGLNGIEVFYYMHDQEATFKLHEIVHELSTSENPVYETPGSDSHFRGKNKKMNTIHFLFCIYLHQYPISLQKTVGLEPTTTI